MLHVLDVGVCCGVYVRCETTTAGELVIDLLFEKKHGLTSELL